MTGNLFNDNSSKRSSSSNPNPSFKPDSDSIEDLIEEDLEDEEDDEEDTIKDIDPKTQFVLEYNLESLVLSKADNPGSLLTIARKHADILGLPQDLTRLRFRQGAQYLDEDIEASLGSIYTLSVGHNRKGNG